MMVKTFLCLVCLLACVSLSDSARPAIIDTDIGSFIDDFFGILLAFLREDLDVKLIVTAYGDTRSRARVLAKFLIAANRTDVPIGIGAPTKFSLNGSAAATLFKWGDIDLDEYVTRYRGTVYTDGVAAMGDVIQSSSETVDILSIAPASNFPSLLDRFPSVVRKARIYSMSGSYYKGYRGAPGPIPEHNVVMCPSCMARMYGAGWPVTVSPIDSSCTLLLTTDAYNVLLSSLSHISGVVMQLWTLYCHGFSLADCTFRPEFFMNDGVFDPAAVLLALSQESAADFVFKNLTVMVTADGYTCITEKPSNCHGNNTVSTTGQGATLRAAMGWQPGVFGQDVLVNLAKQIDTWPFISRRRVETQQI